MSAATPAPAVGRPLPRASDAHMTSEKLKWILADQCGVAFPLTLDARTATVTTSWHYAAAGDVPRLVTAYPTL